jgi:AcrR family transcriptional regulator
MARVRLSLVRITHTAIALVDRDGFDELSLTAVATDLDVGPSALYNHVDGLEGLHCLVAAAATRNLTEAVRNAAVGTAARVALAEMGLAYRRFCLDNPGQFAAILRAPTDGDEDLTAASDALLGVFVLVFVAMGLGEPEARLAARSTRSAIHGFLALEHHSGTGEAHEAEFLYLLAMLQRGIVDSRR